MQVILQQEILALGHEGDVVKVAGGYANNFLIPKGLAVLATPGNLKQLEQKRSGIAKRQAALRAEAAGEAAKIDGKTVTIIAKVGEGGRLYGSITSKDIASAIEAQLGIAVDRKRLDVTEAIKRAGDVTVKVRLYPEVEATVTVTVAGEAAPAGEMASVEDYAEAAEAVEGSEAAAAEESEEAGDTEEAGESEA